MTITNETQLANSLETLLRVGFDHLGIIDPYDRILVALSALQVYSDKMEKCVTVDDLLAHVVDACDIDSVRDALRDTIQTNKGGESRGVSDYVDTVADVVHFVRSSDTAWDLEIEVPVNEQGNIDYEAVRDKMRPIMEKAQKHVDQLVTQYQRYKETNNGKL